MTFVHAFYIILLGVICSSGAQFLFKREEINPNKNFIQKYMNPLVVLAYLLMLVACFLTTLGLIQLPLNFLVVTIGLSALLVNLASYWLFDESLSKTRLLGFTMVAIGIVVYLLPAHL